jgi:hypothetical protein
MAGSEIIICEKRYDIEHPVVTYEDEKGYSAYVPHRTDNIGEIYAFDPAPGLKQRATRFRTRRAMGGSLSLSRMRQTVRQLVIHLDGCLSANMCFNVLHNQRGLSVHFMVDNDGTVYQTLDLAHCAFHAGGVNEVSIGFELQNRGDAARYPKAYPEGRQKVTCRIHGHQFLAYDFTDAQYEAMIRVCRCLTKVLDVPLASPQSEGKPVWTTISAVRSFAGFIGHYHIIDTKWDPGPWDFSRLLHGIGSRVTFPLTALPAAPAAGEQAAGRLAPGYFDNSEQEVEAHFPVGPLGESRLWHGGVHLKGQDGAAVYAVMRGRVVLARLAPPCPVGSCNFVLLEHRFTLGRSWTIFSLYYHLAWPGEAGEEPTVAIPWLKRAADEQARATLDKGEVAMLGINVEPGEVIGTVGEAGPSGYREEQIHFAIFGTDELGRELDPGYWDVIESDGVNRFCTDRRLISRIDRPAGGQPPDGLLSRRELRNFFQLQPRRTELHRVVVRHRSEWSVGDWETQLAAAPDFAQLPPAQRRRLVSQQIAPTLWWTPDAARHANLPANGVVYSYHPIGFLVWFEQMARKYANVRGTGIEGADRWEGKMAPTRLTVDAESGNEMTDEEDFNSGEQNKKLTLEDIVNGYPDDAQ